MPVPRSWDVFCRVIDNFGDAAVCWRLAVSLAAHGTSGSGASGTRVRLWIDDLAALHALQPAVVIDSPRQVLAGVEVCPWVSGADFGVPAEVAVDAFGGGLPSEYAGAMAARWPKSLWIVLEYLSAESWVAGHHGLPSPHPRLPLDRYFFFPGYGKGTGGLLREPDLSGRREDFLRQPLLRQALWQDAGFSPPDRTATVISLFGYEGSAVTELLDAWASGGGAVIAAVPPSRLGADVAAFFGTSQPEVGATLRRGGLEVRFLPFLAQDRYDDLLWTADWNFVRGEDSFVRAQWAERPFAWHIYPQAGNAHLAKLDAFLALYCGELPASLAGPLHALWHGWNNPQRACGGAIGQAWSDLSGQGPALRQHARDWARTAAEAGDLAVNLANFCEKRLKWPVSTTFHSGRR